MDKNIPDKSDGTATASYQYPTLLKHFQCNFIDRVITYALVGISVSAAVHIDNDSFGLKVAAVLLALSYEPVLVTFGRTVGQLVMGIKVKQLSIDQRIPLLNAFARFWLRMVLGWISFLSIHSTQNEGHCTILLLMQWW